MISSDWNQCLAPCGPFDVFTYHNPGLQPRLDRIFQQYTSGSMTLGQATERLQGLIPAPLTMDQMDEYLRESFETYTDVKELIGWCRDHRILFMVNTTGLTGYFQRAAALDLLPSFPVLSAHPLVRFDRSTSDPVLMLELKDIDDKARNTAAAALRYNIPPTRIIILGDSGGDGPHFEWGAHNGAALIGSMTKTSLSQYCSRRSIEFTFQIGHTYGAGEALNPKKEMAYEFTELIGFIEQYLGLA